MSKLSASTKRILLEYIIDWEKEQERLYKQIKKGISLKEEDVEYTVSSVTVSDIEDGAV